MTQLQTITIMPDLPQMLLNIGTIMNDLLSNTEYIYQMLYHCISLELMEQKADSLVTAINS